MSTHGPAYDPVVDGPPLEGQRERIRDYLRGRPSAWFTLAELGSTLNYPEASISAQLRHLRKPRYGGWIVDKRRRLAAPGQGRRPTRQWEYSIEAPPVAPEQLALLPIEER